MRRALVPAACVLSLVGAFVIDLLTPQLLVTAILLDVPIVLSSLSRSRRFTNLLVVAALAADAAAGYFNGVADHLSWDPLAIGDRVLAGFSIVFVGYLSGAVQAAAVRAGQLEAQRSRTARETLLATAIERVRSSLSLELVRRAIARETTVLFAVDRARFILTDRPTGLTLVARHDHADVDLDTSRLSPQAASIVQRTLDARDVLAIDRSDAFGRLVLDHFEAPSALALPLADSDRRYGVLLALGRDEQSFSGTLGLARAYCAQAAGALAQATLFEALEERNIALAERSDVIADLVYALSHDLRTPLTALGLTLRQARAGLYGILPATYGDVLERSITATDDVARLADTLLLVARFESGDRNPQRERVDLAQLCEQIGGELQALAQAHNVTLEVARTPSAMVIGDRDDLRRAVTNLVANALQHGPAGGDVTVALQAGGGVVELSVSDNGFGIPETVRPHLFARFARGESRRGGGTGLGLYIVRRVAQECGGEVAYAPREPRGSVFTLTIPAAIAA